MSYQFTCQYCGKKDEADVKNRKFCSVDCYHRYLGRKHKSNIVTKKCVICGKKFTRYKSSPRAKKYCSRKCYYKHKQTEKQKYMRTIKCKFCGKKIQTNNPDRKYCSWKCWQKSQRRMSENKKDMYYYGLARLVNHLRVEYKYLSRSDLANITNLSLDTITKLCIEDNKKCATKKYNTNKKGDNNG